MNRNQSQLFLLNPVSVGARPGRLAVRRGDALRSGARPTITATGPSMTPRGGCPAGWKQVATTPWGSPVCVPPPNYSPGRADPWKYVYDPRLPNPTPLAWAGIAAGAAALGGAGYYAWHRHQSAQRALATGIAPNDDCTKLVASDSATARAFMHEFVATAVAALQGVPVSTLVLGAGYVQSVAPSCGVKVVEDGIEGADTWQKAAMVGGAALTIANDLHTAGELTDAQFRDEAQAVQSFLVGAGVTDPTMLEQVFEGFGQEAAGGVAPGGTSLRAPNLGILGMGLLGLGAAAAGSAGYFYWRNNKLKQACLGAREWFGPDGSMTPASETALNAAIELAISEGALNAIDAADSAIETLSENPDCHLPKLIWGDLLRVRGIAIAKAAVVFGGDISQLPPPPEDTGIIPMPGCEKLDVSDPTKADATMKDYLGGLGLEPGMSWTPNVIMLATVFMERVAPECGVYVRKEGSPEIMGVDTWQKAAMVGAFALVIAGTLHDDGVLTDDGFTQQSLAINTWLTEHGVDDLTMLEEVFVMPSLSPGESPSVQAGFSKHEIPADEWGQPAANEYVDGGSVGGANGGRWRVYKDNVGDYNNQYYFVVWKAGDYNTIGPFPSAAAAKTAALHQFEIQGNPGYAGRKPPSESALKRMFGSLFGDARAKSRVRARNAIRPRTFPTKWAI